MSSRALCPVLIGRDQQLSQLEDALLAAGRGDSRVVAIAGEAGVGKTRVTDELCRRARKLGFAIMTGGCGQADLQLPYLPFVEAVGNWIAERGPQQVAAELGPVRRELARVFPQLSGDADEPAAGDPDQAKARFLEAAVTLLSIPAREQGLLLIIEDIHWADSSTRELLDHLARRLSGTRVLVLTTYRSDEIERRHPLRPLIQSWRRSGTADLISLDPLSPDGVASMIRTILDEQTVSDEFRDLLYQRSEGIPFVVEEMLKEAIDRADIYRTATGWERKPLDQLAIPETVREAILLRVERLEAETVAVLRAASVLGRSFDYERLVPIANLDELTVEAAIESAVAQQLIDPDPAAPARFRWRHALTQEAIYSEMLLPKRQQLHGRVADHLAGSAATRVTEMAHHLLEAGRFAEAVPYCLDAADEALRTFAFAAAVASLERAVPHAADRIQAGRIIMRLGQACLFAGEARRALEALTEGIEILETSGEVEDAAIGRIQLSRALWEQLQTKAAADELDRAQAVLEPLGASPYLARIHLRRAGLAAFVLDFETCLAEARTGVEIAERAGAEFELLWSKAFVALGVAGAESIDEGLALHRSVAVEAERTGHPFVVQNTCWNEIWLRTHLLIPGADDALQQMTRLPESMFTRSTIHSARASVRVRTGDLHGALDDAERATAIAVDVEMKKLVWRDKILIAEALLALGRHDEALAASPPWDGIVDLQDYIYAAPALIGCRLATGDVNGAVPLAREIAGHAEALAGYRETRVAAAEALVAAGLLDEARAVLAPDPGNDAGLALEEFAWGLLLLAEGDAAEAQRRLQASAERAAALGFAVPAVRARVALARAQLAAGEREAAAETASAAHRDAHAMGAEGFASEAAQIALDAGGTIAPAADMPPAAPGPRVEMGERLVTSMFADIRGYTQMTSHTPPAAMSDRLATLYRWAKTEVERQRGIVDKFAGDAVMATFNVSGATVDHTVHALQAAMALRDKACLTDVGIGVGIAVGPAVVSSTAASPDNLMVMGESTNLAARLQAAAAPGEIVLSAEAFRRVADWLAERGIVAVAEDLTLKGFDEPVRAHRIPGAAQASDK